MGWIALKSNINIMLHPLLLPSLPSLLNASLTTTTPQPQPTRPSSTVYCWEQQPPHQQQLVPTTWIACKEALKGIPLGDAGLKPVTFGRSAHSGFQVPHTWDAGNCVVEIDVEEDDVTETTNFAALMILAFEMAVQCVIPPPHLGGRALIGQEGGLKLMMFGF